MQGLLYAPAIQGADGPVRGPQATSASREQQLWMAVHRPELAQNVQRGIGQGNKAVTVALGVTDVHASPLTIDIADLQGQAFAKAQALFAATRTLSYRVFILCCTAWDCV